jgi:hypothetical protein
LLENKDLPSISAFPKGDAAWRIDWFGEIAFPDRMTRRTQPSVLVYLSKVLDNDHQDNPSVLLKPSSTTPVHFQRKVWVSIGTLCVLRIGDIWCGQRLVSQPDYELETFQNLQIDQSTTTLIKAGVSPDGGAFLLPSAEHPWHMNCTHSYCLVVDISPTLRLVVPCIELIRFYFGSSSSLLTKLFLPPLMRDSLYSKARYDKLGRLTLDLAEKISGRSATDIGQLHLDAVAWKAALQVGTSLLKGPAGQRASFPQALFPFEGETTLTASGKWLSYDSRSRSTFVVFGLRSCSHPFPFRSLRYRQTKLLGRAVNGLRSEETKVPSTTRAASNTPPKVLVEADASNTLAPKEIWFRDNLKFPDLANKTILKSRLLLDGAEKAVVGSKAAPVDAAAVGMEASTRRVRSVELSIAVARESGPIPDFARHTIEQLNQIKGLKVELITDSDDDGWSIPLTVLADEDGECDPTLFLQDYSANLRVRRMVSLTASRNNTYVCISVIEAVQPWLSCVEFEKSLDPLDAVIPDVMREFVKAPLRGGWLPDQIFLFFEPVNR